MATTYHTAIVEGPKLPSMEHIVAFYINAICVAKNIPNVNLRINTTTNDWINEDMKDKLNTSNFVVVPDDELPCMKNFPMDIAFEIDGHTNMISPELGMFDFDGDAIHIIPHRNKFFMNENENYTKHQNKYTKKKISL